MIPKLQEYMNNSRIPLYLRKRNGMIYFQLQIEVAQENGLCGGIYNEFSKIESTKPSHEIGKLALSLLERFHQLSDLSMEDFYQLTGLEMTEYKIKESKERLLFMGATSSDELERAYEKCSIDFDVAAGLYNFGLSWFYKRGNHYYIDFSSSTGEKGVLTFDKPLEFDDNVTPECLGEMILEAFERSRKMSERMSGEFCPTKQIELLDETIIEVTPPKDKHFIDCDDAGVSELYQVYSYISKEGANHSADFMLTVAPELYEDLNCDNIRSAWFEAFGAADDITVTETQYGIYRYRAEMTNKKMYRIAYFTSCKDGLVLECCMEVVNPSKKKKLIEKLPALFEEFALNCKFLN